MQTRLPPVPSGGAVAPAEDLAALRRRTIAALADAIYGRGLPPSTIKQVEHDPVLRQRATAVELLGQFPDPEAVAVLGELVLRGERAIPAPAGRWLRDTALLTLLRSHRLPPALVDQALGRVYSYALHPFPWQWSAVYDDLPLLQRYGKMGVFFRAFWLWPLLVLGGLPTLGAIWQIIADTSVGAVGGGFDWSVLRDLIIVLGTGLEIYLVHQVVIALLAGLYGPPLRLPNRATPRWKAVVGAGLALLVLVMLLVMLVVVVTSAFTVQVEGVSTGQIVLRLAVLIFPCCSCRCSCWPTTWSRRCAMSVQHRGGAAPWGGYFAGA